MTNKTLLKLAAAAIAFAASSIASATTMSVTYDPNPSVTPNSTLQNVSISFNALAGAGASWSTVGAGRLAFAVSAHDALDPVSTYIYSFCIEPTQILNTSSSITYQVDALKDSQLVSTPTIKLSDDASKAGTDTKAQLISQLFAKAYASTGSQFLQQGTTISADVAAAMQFAIWEIIEETSATYDVTAGNAQFKMTDNGTYGSVAAHTSAVATLANSYLSSLTTGGAGVNGLFALDSTATQNQIGQYTLTTTPSRLDVPEPATLGLFGFGAIAMGLRRRKAK